MLIKHVHDKNGRLVGTIVALSPKQVGTAFYNTKTEHKPVTKEMGITIAKGRAIYNMANIEEKIPNLKKLGIDVKEEVANMYTRASRLPNGMVYTA